MAATEREAQYSCRCGHRWARVLPPGLNGRKLRGQTPRCPNCGWVMRLAGVVRVVRAQG